MDYFSFITFSGIIKISKDWLSALSFQLKEYIDDTEDFINIQLVFFRTPEFYG